MMRPRKTLNACAAGALAICFCLSQPLSARLQNGGEQPPSIVPKYEAPRTGTTPATVPGTSIPDELWKTDRNRLGNSTEQSSNTTYPPAANPQTPTQTLAQQPAQSQPQPSPQSQSTLVLNQYLPRNNQAQVNNQNQLGNGAGQTNSALGSASNNHANKVINADYLQSTQTASPGLAGPGGTTQTGNVSPASYDSSRAQSRTVLQPKSKSDDSSKSKSSGGTLQMLISVASSLAIVISLFIGVAYLYRKSISTTLGKGLPKNVVQVLGRTTIAPRQQLVLVRFGSKLVLVSMLQGEARTISEITDPLEVDQLAGFCESSQSGSITSSFRDILTQGVKA